MSDDGPVVVIDSQTPAALDEAKRRAEAGETIVLVCSEGEAEAAGAAAGERLAVMVDDGDSRSMAVAAALEMAAELFPGRPRPNVISA